MAEMERNPDQEIKDVQKRIFVAAFERLHDFIELDVPTPEELEVFPKSSDRAILVRKVGCFLMDGLHYTLENNEYIELDEVEDETVTSGLWEVTVRQPEILVGGTLLQDRATYLVGNLDGVWVADYHEVTTSQGQNDGNPRILPKDHEIEDQTFWQGEPSDEEVQARIEMRDAEMEEHESTEPPATRFSQERMTHILYLLVQLGAEHVVPVEEYA